ncbi:MAG: tetratricopeptide repeat protein [Chitinispirillaceae bacterium]|nr:tetratricopeptide repeat protein [Chitinispirillaceae bacterium]
MKTNSLFLFTLLCLSAARGAPVEHWFEQANRAYADGRFDSAAAYYERIIESGMENAAVLYNYGNVLYRLKKMGPARLAYEQASRLNPNDPDIAANIRFIQSNIVDRVSEPERGFLDTVLWKLHILVPLKQQLWIALALLSIISFCIGWSFFASRNLRLWLVYLSILFGLLLSFLGGSIGVKIYESEKIAYAIVVVPSIDAKNEPEGSTVLFTAHEGTKFRIRKTMNDWALVSLPNGVSGWVERKVLGTI